MIVKMGEVLNPCYMKPRIHLWKRNVGEYLLPGELVDILGEGVYEYLVRTENGDDGFVPKGDLKVV